jgi:two-component system, response regulator
VQSVNEAAVEILLVEDDPNDVELTLRALRQHNLANRVRVLQDGAEALDYLLGPGPAAARRTGEPRLILLDLKLPKVDGHEVLRRLKADPVTRAIPVVILTSSAEERDIARSYRVGANSYIVKPVDFDGFSAAVVQVGLYWMVLNQVPRGDAARTTR